MSDLKFPMRQAKSFIALVISDEYGFPVKGVQFINEGSHLMFDVKTSEGTLSFNRAEIQGRIQDWVNVHFPKNEMQVFINTKHGEAYNEHPAMESFTDISISGVTLKITIAIMEKIRDQPSINAHANNAHAPKGPGG